MTARPVPAPRPGGGPRLRLRLRPGGRSGAATRPRRGRPVGRGPRLVRARFRLSDLPGITVTPAAPGADGAGAAASRALTRAGLGHLGGHLVLRGPGGPPRVADLARAAERAVAVALRRTR
ncbi:hypothetical protein [Streptomyces sp. NPDC058279]|uniref:hypothetical protein n=1 Tax=Streptomyces sp. NPDC058279 TaxID=3346418 RepID=UPI0036E980CC